MKSWLLAVTLLFIVALVAGLQITPGEADLSAALSGLVDLLEMLEGLPPLLFALFIFVNNVITLVVSFALAPLLGIFPIFVVAFNGWLIGVVVSGIVQSEGAGYAVAGLLPHGIIEIPAFLLGEATALSFALVLVTSIFRRESRARLFPSFVRHAKLLGLAAALLLPAALIETFITPRLLGI